jgi:Tol biopolymer transport system component
MRRIIVAAVAAVAVLVAAVAVVAMIGWLRPRAPAETSRQRVVLWRYALANLLDPGAIEETQAALAPDGASIVFTDSTEGHLQLMRKERSASVAIPILGTEGAVSPFFSPDGHWIGFSTTDGMLKKVPIEGGGAVTLAHRTDPTYTAATWLDDGTIVYAEKAGLAQISSDGQSHQLSTDSAYESATAVTVAPLPGSRAVLYTACPNNCGIQSAVHVLDLQTHSDRVLVPNAAGAWYSPTGHLLYTDRAGGLYAVRFDLARLRVTSGPVPVIDGVVPGTFSLTRWGTALYATAAAGRPAELEWVARDGSAVPFDSTWRGDFVYPALSPDGKTLAVSVRDATTQLWVRRPDGSRQRLTEEGTTNWRPAWTPDGRSIAFSSNRSSTTRDVFDLYEVPADGNAPARLLLHHTFGVWEGEFSGDGRWLVMRSDEAGNVGHIYGRRLVGDSTLVPLVVDTTISLQIALSPDGRWIAYSGYATGQIEVYVAPFPGMRPTRLVSHAGGSEPRWAHSGRELFYREGARFMVVPLSTQPTLTLGIPRVLFSAAAYRSARNRPQYAVAPDDRHFLMIRDLESSTAVMYVENWFPELLAKLKR